MRKLIYVCSALILISMVNSSAATAASRTYLVNGIASAIPFIGYGMRNLKKKIPGAKLFSYISAAEAGAIRRSIIKDAAAAYRASPGLKLNFVGISYGANMITEIAAALGRQNVPVNYLGIIDGTNLKPLGAHIRKADNFICTNADCTGARVRLAPGNRVTATQLYSIKSSHIPLGDNATVHSRVVQQVR